VASEYFSLLIDQLIETENVHVILIGGPDEAALGGTILDAIANPKSVWSLIGSVRLGDLPALIARCALFVGNNSGPQHIAAGLGVRRSAFIPESLTRVNGALRGLMLSRSNAL